MQAVFSFVTFVVRTYDGGIADNCVFVFQDVSLRAKLFAMYGHLHIYVPLKLFHCPEQCLKI